MGDTTIRSFPADEFEALAMLWVRQQDLSASTPEEIFDKYQDAYNKISAHSQKQDDAKYRDFSL